MSTITDLSNLPAMFDAVYEIAQGVPGFAVGDTFQGLWPAPEEIQSARFLVVPYPEFAGFGRGGRKTGKILTPGTQLIELYHDFSIYVVSGYDPTKSATWQGPMEAMGYIVRDFVANPTLNGTCTYSHIDDPHLLEWINKYGSGERYFGCQVTIEAYEQVLTPRT